MHFSLDLVPPSLSSGQEAFGGFSQNELGVLTPAYLGAGGRTAQPYLGKAGRDRIASCTDRAPISRIIWRLCPFGLLSPAFGGFLFGGFWGLWFLCFWLVFPSFCRLWVAFGCFVFDIPPVIADNLLS